MKRLNNFPRVEELVCPLESLARNGVVRLSPLNAHFAVSIFLFLGIWFSVVQVLCFTIKGEYIQAEKNEKNFVPWNTLQSCGRKQSS